MKNSLLKAPLLIFVWSYSLTEAKTPPIPRITLPPDFYQVIITNNLFRPLGWARPKPKPRFELIATVIKRNGKHKTLIRNTLTRKFYYVAMGDALGEDVTVAQIERRRVTLNENEVSTVYHLNLFESR